MRREINKLIQAASTAIRNPPRMILVWIDLSSCLIDVRGTDVRITPRMVWSFCNGRATYIISCRRVLLYRMDRPLLPFSALAISGRPAWLSIIRGISRESPTTCPEGNITVIRVADRFPICLQIESTDSESRGCR